MSNIPAWAALIYGLMEAPKMAKGVTDVWQGINDLRYGANFNEDTNSLFNAKNPQEIKNLQPQSMSPDQRKEFETLRQFQLGKKYEEEAAPLLQAINDFNTNPNFQDYESRQVVAQDPIGAISNPGSADRQMLQNNPKAREALQRFQQQNSNVLRFTDADRSLTGQITDPMQAATARGWSQTIEPEHLAARTDQTKLALSTAAHTAQLNRNQAFSDALSSIPTDADYDTKLNAITMAIAKYQPDEKLAGEVVKGALGLKPDMHIAKVGTGEMDEEQTVIADARKGTYQPMGEVLKQSPRGTHINVMPEAATASALKAIGPTVMSDLTKSHETARKASDELQTLSLLDNVLKSGTPTGWGADTTMKARQIITSVTGQPASQNLTNQELLNSINTLLSARAQRQADANPTARQVEMMRKAYPGLNTTQATNLALTQNLKRSALTTINAHNSRVKNVRNWPQGNDLGAMVEGQYLVETPQLSLQDRIDMERQRRMQNRGR